MVIRRRSMQSTQWVRSRDLARPQFCRRRIPNRVNFDVINDYLAGERVVSIQRHLAVSDLGHPHSNLFPIRALKRSFGAHSAKLLGNILNFVGECQIGTAFAEAFMRLEFHRARVARRSPFQGAFQFRDEVTAVAVYVPDRDIHLLHYIARSIGDTVSNENHSVFFDA